MAEHQGTSKNWSEDVEELLDGGDDEGAISLLESVVAKLEAAGESSFSDLQLSCALADLAKLYQSQGFSIKADELQSRALLIRLQSQDQNQPVRSGALESVKKVQQETTASEDDATPNDDDDWEALADRPSNEIFSRPEISGISDLSLKDTKLQTPKRRGRGTFLYEKDGLYSDQIPSSTADNESEDEFVPKDTRGSTDIRNSICGTGHVLVLSGFPPNTRTRDLENMFQNYKDRGVAIRWINDTTALAVFRSPSIAHEARSSIHFPFATCTLDENDELLTSVAAKDLEPPYPRPKTSARTAQRLIAQGIGRKLPPVLASNELKKQEDARKNRIVTRQTLRDEAWGPDDL